MTNIELAKAIKSNLFKNDLKTLDELSGYVEFVAKGSRDQAAVWQAVMTTLNTVANIIEQNERVEA